jgi:hypothetical protein
MVYAHYGRAQNLSSTDFTYSNKREQANDT